MITDIRLRSQQLVNPAFNDPKELVAWMGALQGQEYSMAKWAVGLRLKKPDIRKVEAALEKGEILRTHVLRPDLASGGGGGYSMDVEVVGQTGEVGVRFVLEKSWNIGRVVYQKS